MKKRFALMLILCLLCGTPALALRDTNTIQADGGSQDTLVTYEVVENKDFSVMIPATLSIRPETNTGSIDLEIDATGFNAPNYVIAVCLTGSTGYVESEKAFYLTNGANTIPYELQRRGSTLRMTEPILTWTSGAEPALTTAVTVKAIATPEGDLPAGTYTDTLTFTAMLIDLNDPTSGSNP